MFLEKTESIKGLLPKPSACPSTIRQAHGQGERYVYVRGELVEPAREQVTMRGRTGRVPAHEPAAAQRWT